MGKDTAEDNRNCVLIDESTIISGKSVLVACLLLHSWKILSLLRATTDAITETLRLCLKDCLLRTFSVSV